MRKQGYIYKMSFFWNKLYIFNSSYNLIPALFLLIFTSNAYSQDLDPRAYVRLPIQGTILISGLNYSHGGVLTDPTLPLTDFEATIEGVSVGMAHTFGLFGQTAQAFVVMPYSWAQASALVTGQPESTTRNGFADMRLRLSVLLLGGKATTFSEFAKKPKRTILGTSLTVIAPTGQYFSDKLINLGTSRWSFKPEIALSQKFGKRMMFDFYSAIWFFTSNKSFYPGNSIRTQDPLLSFQSHLSYNLGLRAWVAFDVTYYTGGQSSVNAIYNDDRQSNSRIGATLSLPVGKRNSVKIAFNKGAIIRVGADFSTISVGWQTGWFKKQKQTEELTK
jgi:hypothetical protein